MTRKAETPAADAAPVSGELVDPPAATVRPDQASQNASADRARGRTAVQVTLPAAFVGIGVWLAGFAHLDLDPLGPGREIPGPVAGYFVAVVAYLLAVKMNPKDRD